MKKISMAVIALMMTLSASAQFYIYFSDGAVAKVDSISLQPIKYSITLNQTEVEMVYPSAMDLDATISPISNENLTIAWSSSNPEVASIDTSGWVVTKGLGTAIISATPNIEGVTPATCIVTVTNTSNTGTNRGADLSNVVIHDFSVTTENTYVDFTTLTDGAPNTRGSDFDGEHVLIVSRADKVTPTHHLLKVSDLLKGNINKIELSKEGIEGGTLVVSAGCLSHGHIYVCNMTTNLGNGEDLKVYHYASPEAAPEVWSWDGVLSVTEFGDTIFATSRLGDNISVNLDENGNGYAFFCGMESSAEKIYRVQITNFNQFSNPTEIILEEAFPYYGKVNQVDENRYLLTSHYMASTWLIDKDGNPLVDIYFQSTAAGLKPQTGVDPHVVKYNGGYYLIFASPYNNTKRLGVGPALYMIDITEGSQVDIQTALQNLSDILWEDEDGIWEPDYHYSLDVLDVEAEAHKTFTACTAQCNAAVVDGKLLVYAAAAGAGFAIIEFVPARSE